MEYALCNRARRWLPVLLVCGLSALAIGCGGSTETAVSENTTCEDYLSQPGDVRHDAAVRISSELGVESSGNPMWGLSLDAACGGNPSKTLGQLFRHEDAEIPATEETSAETVYEETETETVDQTSGSFSPTFWIESDAELPDGSSARERMELGDLVAASDFEASGGFAGLSEACEVDAQRDALLPGKLVVENTTKRFPIEITSGIVVGTRPTAAGENPYPEKPVTDIAQNFETDPSCEPYAGAAPVEFELSSGETGRQNFLIVVHDYYSPAHPGGRKSDLGDLRTGINFPIPLATDWERTCVSASAPLDGELTRLDGGPITEHQFEPSDLPSCS